MNNIDEIQNGKVTLLKFYMDMNDACKTPSIMGLESLECKYYKNNFLSMIKLIENEYDIPLPVLKKLKDIKN